jgi:hypothetical protein
MKKRDISPHEPDEPIAGIAEAIRDSDEMKRVWEQKQRRMEEAVQKLRQAGMTVLGAPVANPKRKRGKQLSK